MAAAAAQASICPPSTLNYSKGNQLYLYLRAGIPDITFPSFGGVATSPLNQFSVFDLDPSIGTTAQLRNLVWTQVVDDYCEFDVNVNLSTSKPSPTVPRWQIVGVGSDSATVGGGILFGIAQAADINDNVPQDFSRVFARSFKDAYGGAGNALHGANSTLKRWATAIGETAAHEAAHNYGAQHRDSAPRPNSAEDDANWHIMATGSTGLTGELRASRNRHFSDTEYEILGHNVGLHTKTLHNWDFTNPNNKSANRMRIKLLSDSSSLSIGWWYDLNRSPWQKPTVTYTGDVQSFQGSSYYVHNLDFTTPQAWSGSTPGVVAPAQDFHTGASFTGNAKVIVFDVQLFDGTTLLPLAPRLAGYDTGDLEFMTGNFNLSFFNTNPDAGGLELSEVLVFSSPRMIDLNTMMRDARPTDIRGVPVELRSSLQFDTMGLDDRVTLTLGKLTDKRSVDLIYEGDPCPPPGEARAAAAKPAGGAADGEGVEVEYCVRGNALSLFPATYTYVIATVVEPSARYWNPDMEEFVTGPRQNIIYYQMAGILPDLNHNGIDDLIDIRTGVSNDEDRNGVPDEAKPEGEATETGEEGR